MKPKPTKWLAWALAISFIFLNTSCGLLHKEKFKKEDGLYIRHYQSCGPDSIQDAILKLERKLVSRKSISQDIQSTGNISRLLLASFDYRALEITFPCELKKYLNKKGYNIQEVSFDSLKEGDVAIVLIKGPNLLKQWHWITYPTHSKEYIKNFFSSTEVISVLKITS